MSFSLKRHHAIVVNALWHHTTFFYSQVQPPINAFLVIYLQKSVSSNKVKRYFIMGIGAAIGDIISITPSYLVVNIIDPFKIEKNGDQES